MPAAGSKLTYNDLLAWPEDQVRHELIDGEHFMSPSPLVRHQRISRRLLVALEAWNQEARAGEVLYAPTDVIFSPSDVVVPDLLFVSVARAAIVGEKNIQGAPDLLVEILSPATRGRDLGAKLRLYERFGVREYWIVAPDANTMTVHRPETPGTRPQLLTAAGTVTSPVLPGLALSLAAIFQ
ncbi:MAG: Uma2 family endonuclease [Terriglobales bacterium]